MIAAKMGDPVLGLDIHAVLLPPPAPPVPTPLPHPFIGVVFDPIALGLAGAMGAVFGGGGPVFVNGLPAGNTGTNVKGIPHFPTPPGIAPHPLDAPTGNHGTLVTGSKTVHFMGSSESRTSSSVNSCGFPVNLPTSVCMAVPMGPPVLIGGPEAVDWMAAITSGIRTKWMSNVLHDLTGAKSGSWLSKIICFLTGHPVDVMSGELIAEAVDFEVPGLIPIKWERNYRSRQSREGALGPGWTHPFDELIEDDGTGLRLWLGDGRPKNHRRLAVDESLWDAQDRYALTRTSAGYELRSWNGERRLYQEIPEGAAHVLVEVRDRAGARIRFDYERGYLVRIRDTANREIDLTWTRAGRLEGLYFEGRSLARYRYDDEGRLTEAIDPLGASMRYEYRGGVMTKEVHKGGLTFFFEWDWYHPEGWCIRTWGENPARAERPDGEGVPKHIYDRRITYDAARHFTTVTDGRGGVTSYWGNALGLVEKEMGPTGFAKEYVWDRSYRKLSETDEEGNRFEWRYDDRGNCVWERDPVGRETTQRFDPDNQCTEIVDRAGGLWTLTWDRHGRPERIQNPLGLATRYRHDDRGRLFEIEDPMGRRVRATWNERNDLESVTDGDGHATSYRYDALGHLVGSRDAAARTMRVLRDEMSRPTYVEHPDGERISLKYDVEGNVVEQTDVLGRRVKLVYEGLHRVVEHIDPLGYRVRFSYDTEEQMVAVENQIGERYRFERDVAGQVSEEIGFDGKKHRYLYDKAGRTKRVLGPAYATTKLERDGLGRVIKRTLTSPAGLHDDPRALGRKEEEVFEYDRRGDLIAVHSGAVDLTFERDGLGRVVRELRSSGGVTRAVESRFDYSGLRVERDTSLGHRTWYAWSDAGRLAEMRADFTDSVLTPTIRDLRLPLFELPEWEVKFSRDPIGQEVARRMPGGVVGIWKRDAFGRPVEREILSGAFAGQQSRRVGHVGYRWTGPDQIAAITDATAGTTHYTHDERGHLTGATFGDGTVQHRASDAVSNLFKTADGRDRRYGRGGRLERAGNTEYRYDAAGNLIEKLLADGASWKYLWTPTGHLAEVIRPDKRRVSFTYDALGRRIQKQFDGKITEFVWDGNDLVHERVTDALTGKAQPLVTWLFEPGTFAPVAKFEGRKRYSVLTDVIGTPTMLMTEAGKLAWKAQLDLYGVPREERSGIEESDRTTNPLRYPGQYYDDETGLCYNRYRYYDINDGRYLTSDPAGLLAGTSVYAYVRDPLQVADPFGLMPWAWNPDDGMGHHLVPRNLANSAGMTDLGTPRDTPTFFPQPYTPGDHELMGGDPPRAQFDRGSGNDRERARRCGTPPSKSGKG